MMISLKLLYLQQQAKELRKKDLNSAKRKRNKKRLKKLKKVRIRIPRINNYTLYITLL